MPSEAAQEWLDLARADEFAAKVLLEAGGSLSLTAYHLQQSGEKLIKAVLVEEGVAPNRTHDLTKLLKTVPGRPAPKAVVHAAHRISPYAFTRYPGSGAIRKVDVSRGIRHLATIMNWALRRLKV